MTQISQQHRLHDLAPSQIPEWYSYQLIPDSAVYNISFNHFFLTKIDPAIFLQAWQHILDRHDIFRIRITYADGKPKQFLSDRVILHRETLLIDRTILNHGQIAEEQQKQASYFALKPFNFDSEALFRLHLIAYAGDEYQLIFTVHHIIWDETSTMNLIREFAALYMAYSEKREIILPALPYSFLAYADRVNQDIASGRYAHHRAYWMEQFKQLPEPLNLPTDHPRPALQTFNGNTAKIWLPHTLTREIHRFCANHNTTIFMLLLAVLDVYLYRISGQDDFVLGCPIAGRGHEEKSLLGCFAVPMPIRCRITSGMSFDELLNQVKKTVIDAFEHYCYPCVSMIEQLSHVKDLSRPKLFSLMTGVQNNKSEFMNIALGEGSLYAKEIYSAENHGARFDLAIGMDLVGSDIKFFCTYNRDLYEEDSVVRILDDVASLFSRVIADPRQTVATYPLLSAVNAQRVLVDVNRTEMKYETGNTIIDWIDQQSIKQPNAVAVISADGALSYAEFARLSMKIAASLLAVGVAEQEPVGVLLVPDTTMLASLLAIMRIGAIYVPLNEEWPPSRLADVAIQVGFKVVLTCKKLRAAAATLSSQLLFVEHVDEVPTTIVNNRARPGNVAYILFTSGSTGKPKGIPIGHQGLFNLIASTQARYKLTMADRMLFWTACSFDVSLLDICWPLACGAQIVLWPLATSKAPDTIIDVLDDYGVTVFQTVPTTLDVLCDARLRQPNSQSKLRLIICGAAALRGAVCKRVARAFGCRLANHYCPTEVTVDE
jgi:non-ribosomal peptide synthetase component F